jgi:hypothetical protein
MVTTSSATRCPACGQPLETPVPRCPLCDYELSSEEGVTGVDITPYAQAYVHGRPGWAAMLWWVWLAGSGRMKHLALMKVSAAARRFAIVNGLLVAVSVGLCEWTLTGWHTSFAARRGGSVAGLEPAGDGWIAFASAARPLPPGFPDDAPTDLWWNAAQCLIAVPLGGVLALLLFWLLGRTIDLGVSLSHVRSYRQGQRLTAAVRYSTAWAVPVFAAGVMVGLRPVAYAGAVTRSWWAVPEQVFLAPAAIVAGATVALWWFWLGRLGATAPASTRGRVIVFLVVVVPVLAAGYVALWWYGRLWVYDSMFEAMGLAYS